ncbi:hypothetical protein AgCh_022270 [Apium graveolens]
MITSLPKKMFCNILLLFFGVQTTTILKRDLELVGSSILPLSRSDFEFLHQACADPGKDHSHLEVLEGGGKLENYIMDRLVQAFRKFAISKKLFCMSMHYRNLTSRNLSLLKVLL